MVWCCMVWARSGHLKLGMLVSVRLVVDRRFWNYPSKFHCCRRLIWRGVHAAGRGRDQLCRPLGIIMVAKADISQVIRGAQVAAYCKSRALLPSRHETFQIQLSSYTVPTLAWKISRCVVRRCCWAANLLFDWLLFAYSTDSTFTDQRMDRLYLLLSNLDFGRDRHRTKTIV